MNKTRLILLGLILSAGFIFTARVLDAQVDVNTDCPLFVVDAIERLDDYCDGLDRNNACYGNNQVLAEFADGVTSDVFDQTGDTAPLVDLQTIHTSPLNRDLGYWGISVLNVQANLPDTLPGQATLFLLLGDVTLENAVPNTPMVTPMAGLTLSTIDQRTNLRIFPDRNATIVNSVPPNGIVSVDSVNETGEWVGVLYEGQRLWMTKFALQQPEQAASLPVLDPTHLSPMQAFYLTTGIGNVGCASAPDSLVVQGPNQVAVDIQANGAYIRIGSTILLRLIDGNQMQLMTLSGQAYVDGVIVPAGFTAYAPLDSEGMVVGAFGGLHGVSCSEMQNLLLAQSVPASLLHYAIVLPACDQRIEVANTLPRTDIVTGYMFVPPASSVGISVPSSVQGSTQGGGSSNGNNGNGNNGNHYGHGNNGNGNNGNHYGHGNDGNHNGHDDDD